MRRREKGKKKSNTHASTCKAIQAAWGRWTNPKKKSTISRRTAHHMSLDAPLLAWHFLARIRPPALYSIQRSLCPLPLFLGALGYLWMYTWPAFAGPFRIPAMTISSSVFGITCQVWVCVYYMIIMKRTDHT